MIVFPEEPQMPSGDTAADIEALYNYLLYMIERLEWLLSTLS